MGVTGQGLGRSTKEGLGHRRLEGGKKKRKNLPRRSLMEANGKALSSIIMFFTNIEGSGVIEGRSEPQLKIKKGRTESSGKPISKPREKPSSLVM